jgi:hypothetical protein
MAFSSEPPLWARRAAAVAQPLLTESPWAVRPRVNG